MADYVWPLLVLATCCVLMWPLVWAWDRWMQPVVVELAQSADRAFVNHVVRWHQRRS